MRMEKNLLHKQARMVVLDAAARQKAGISENSQMLDNPCPGDPSTFLCSKANVSIHPDCVIHVLTGRTIC